MNQSTSNFVQTGRNAAWIIGVVGSLAIMAFLVTVMIRTTRPADLRAARAVERIQFRNEVRQAESAMVSEYAWQDQAKGFVRIPVSRAMELVVQEWQDPAAARSNMIARVAEATAPPPEPVNPYE